MVSRQVRHDKKVAVRVTLLLSQILGVNHKTCINTSRQALEKTLFAINAIFDSE